MQKCNDLQCEMSVNLSALQPHIHGIHGCVCESGTEIAKSRYRYKLLMIAMIVFMMMMMAMAA